MTSAHASASPADLAADQENGVIHTEDLTKVYPGTDFVAVDKAAFTTAPHLQLYVIYPVVIGFTVVFLAIGLRNSRRRVLS